MGRIRQRAPRPSAAVAAYVQRTIRHGNPFNAQPRQPTPAPQPSIFVSSSSSSSGIGGPRLSSGPTSTITRSGMTVGELPPNHGTHGFVPIQYQAQALPTVLGQPSTSQQQYFGEVNTSNQVVVMPSSEDGSGQFNGQIWGNIQIKVEPEDLPDDSAMELDMFVHGMSMNLDPFAAGYIGIPQTEEQLKVEDALRYLDLVKYQFGNQPRIYNEFLDIMKLFKSQDLDTFGVVTRVSSLFRGYPALIHGLNSFLPTGYMASIQPNDSLAVSLHGGNYLVAAIEPAAPGPSGHPGRQAGTNHQQLLFSTAPSRPQLFNSSSTSTSSGRVSAVFPPSVASTSSAGGASAPTHPFTLPFAPSDFVSLHSPPLEFNFAVNYVNRIKIRFQETPETYRQFLQILYVYQQQQRNIQDGNPPAKKPITELDVYSHVANLFENQQDLLSELGRFVPEVTNQNTRAIQQARKRAKKPLGLSVTVGVPPKKRAAKQPGAPRGRPPKNPPAAPLPNCSRYATFSDTAQQASTSNDIAFFEKVLGSIKQEDTSKQFVVKRPYLHNWFKDFAGVRHDSASGYDDLRGPVTVEPNDEVEEENIVEIDYTTCKRVGYSYCAMPANHKPPSCAGRSLEPHCNDVLNDSLVSVPIWGEGRSLSFPKKTKFEESMYRIEDARFELDVIIETNSAILLALEYVAKKMGRMSKEELETFELDDCLGGRSATTAERAIRRIYGDNKAPEIIEGLKKFPVTAVPVVIRRLRAKEEEWRDVRYGLKEDWNEKTEKNYWKSLDVKGITFKQTDIRTLRSKTLLKELDMMFPNDPLPPPRLLLLYPDRSILDDACALLLHYVSRQTGIPKGDKGKIEQFLKQFLADLFRHTRMELSDEEEAPPDEGGSKKPRKRNGKRGGQLKSKKKVPAKSALKEVAAPSTLTFWTELAKQKNMSTVQESRRTMAKRELKLVLSDNNAQELTDITSLSLRDRANLEGLGEISNDDTGMEQEPQPSTSKGHMTRQTFEAGTATGSTPIVGNTSTRTQKRVVAPSLDEVCDDEPYTLLYVNSKLYVFLRLHHILCERLSTIRDRALFHLAEQDDTKERGIASHLSMVPTPVCEVSEYYPHFLELVRSRLDCNIGQDVYEDTLHRMFSIHAYIAFTLDKVVSCAVKQLQGIMTDGGSGKCLELFLQAGMQRGNCGFGRTLASRRCAEIVYQKQVETVCAKGTCVKVKIFLWHSCRRMTVQLVAGGNRTPTGIGRKSELSDYVTKFLRPDTTIPESIKEALRVNPVFLLRNIRKWKVKSRLQWESDPRNPEGHHSVVETVGINIGEVPVGEVYGKETPVETNANAIQEEMSVGGSKTGDAGPSTKPGEGVKEKLLIKSFENSTNERTGELLMQENLKCQFNLSSYRMVYLPNSEDCIYLSGAMQRARRTQKQVATRLSRVFRAWHDKWVDANVSKGMKTEFRDLLLRKPTATVQLRKSTRKSVSFADQLPCGKG